MQVKKSICEWLAWFLRVKRPGRDFSRRYLIRQKKMRDLESKQPQSRSLISNIRDVDNVIPVGRMSNNDFHPFKREPSEDFGGFKSELLQILNELRYITGKMKEDSLANEEVNDWKFAALVIDRLCLIIFSLYTVIVTLGIFFAAPDVFTRA